MLKKLLLSASIAAAILVAPAQPSPFKSGPWWKSQAMAGRQEHLSMFNVTQLIGFGARGAATAGPVAVYRDTQTDTTNATSGSVSVSIGPADAGRVVYIIAACNRSSGGATANPTISTSSGTPSLITGHRSGVYAFSVYSVSGCTGTTLTVTITGDGSTQLHHTAHVWTTTSTVTLLDTVTVGSTVSTVPFNDVQVAVGGFVILAFARGGTPAETSESYNGVDTASKDFAATVEALRRVAGTVARTTEAASGNDFAYNYAGGQLSVGICCSFTP